ncbi:MULTISPECIES: hypothetical protein [unclassified Nonlabens]|uniref:hypothetical protein n=1 Tax=unclassified Nonlabens TaxID=2615035 RepID=UPI0038696487
MNKFLLLFLMTVSYSVFGQSNFSVYDQDKETIIEYFKQETIGGKLDFELKMKDVSTPFYRVENTLYNRKDMGILLWAKAIKMTEQFTEEEAYKLWEEIQERKLTEAEQRAFEKGFSMKSEK